MPKETFDYDEREVIDEINQNNIDLIKKYISNSEVFVVGRFDKSFWEEVVLSKPKEVILDPADDFSIVLMENLTHFGVITMDEFPDREQYYGNSSLSLEDFTLRLLYKTVRRLDDYNKGIS